MTDTDVMTRLRAADPAVLDPIALDPAVLDAPVLAEGWTEVRTAAFVAATTAHEAPAHAAAHAAAHGGGDHRAAAPAPARTRARRTRRAVAVGAGLAVVALVGTAVGLPPQHTDDTGVATRPWSLLAVPNAAAAELDAYTASALSTEPGVVPVGSFYYVRMRDMDIDQDSPGHAAVVSREIQENWTGQSRTDGSMVETDLGVRFRTPADRAAYLAHGGSLRVMPQQVFSPLGDTGAATFRWPDAEYAARIPTDLDELTVFLHDEVDSLYHRPHATAREIEDAVMGAISLPWLSPAQRGALIQVIGRLPGGWRVVGTERVAGIDGVVVELPQGPGRGDFGRRQQLTLSTQAPGILRSRAYVDDPSDKPLMYGDLPAGTLVDESTVTAFGLVPGDLVRPAG